MIGPVKVAIRSGGGGADFPLRAASPASGDAGYASQTGSASDFDQRDVC